MATSHQWQFAPRFRRKAFGWQSDTPITRIKEALAEIKAVAKKEPVVAAEGAVLFLTKLAPAVEQVDSSSGRIGSVIHAAIATLAATIAAAPVDDAVRAPWLERLWTAYLADDMPSIEYMGDLWGEICASKTLAAAWADRLAPLLATNWEEKAGGIGSSYFKGTAACFSALYHAGRVDQLLAMIAQSEHGDPWWEHRRWGARALAATGKHAEAIRYAEAADDATYPDPQIAAFCERVLLENGYADEAYARYGIKATSATTNAARFKAVVKKYPQIPRDTVLRDLVASTPGEEGKWFAAAKDAGFFDLAIELANRSVSDPRTLTRAARDYADRQPEFALAAGMTALRGIAAGWGYEITGEHVQDAYAAAVQAATVAGVSEATVRDQVRALVAAGGINSGFIGRALGRQMVD